AGISSNQLIIALEPEAAAIFCGFLNVEKSEHGDSLFRFKSGSKVIVVDAGGVPPVILKAHTRGKNIQDVIKESQFASKVSITEDKMMVNVSELANLSKPQFDRIVDHVSKLIDQSTIGDIAAICLVGGFSKCSFFQQAMKTKFHNHTIIVPNYQPDLAVLIGAVICGHKPELISQRVSKYTYGVEIRVPFIEHVHRESYKVRNDDGDVQCKHAFGKHITAGQCLIDEESHVTTGLFPATLSQTTACLSFYYTLDPDPMYVTGEGCHLAGRLEVPLEGTGTDRCVMVRMIYRRPAIKVEATEVATGTVHRLNIGFLSKTYGTNKNWYQSVYKTGSSDNKNVYISGPVDIAAQEVAENGSMKNIYKASGGDRGGTKVDEAYVILLQNMLEKDPIDAFKRCYMDDYIFMIRDFEMKKRGVDPLKSDKLVIFRVSAMLPKLIKNPGAKKIYEAITDTPFDSTVLIQGDKLKVDLSVVTTFFKAQIDAIVDHVSNIIEQSTIGGIEAIILVGGFSNCSLLQQAIKSRFVSNTIIILNEPYLAVLKGAVIFGHKPELIT
ncbi:HS12A-like protein, partial [Mya arenaria]